MKQSTINFLANIKNHSSLKKENLEQNFYLSTLKIVKLLYKEGFIQSFGIKYKKNNSLKKAIKIILRFYFNQPVINKVSIISKFSNKTFIKYKQLLKLSPKSSILIISTSKGILTHSDCIKKKIGGILLFCIN
jgi:small subunit ribosomal protein S8